LMSRRCIISSAPPLVDLLLTTSPLLLGADYYST
jgi:hypothetical protein